MLHLLTAAFGTRQNTAYGAVCPQLAKADMRAKRIGSGFDPSRTRSVHCSNRVTNMLLVATILFVLIDADKCCAARCAAWLSTEMATSVKQLLEAANAVVPKVTPAQAREMMAKGNTLVVDVRDGRS